MCGIFGLKLDNLSHETAKNFGLSLIHRGPENINFSEVEKNYFLGHVRLRIVDVTAKSDQPMISINGRYSISYNGEIYNYKELAKEYNLGDQIKSDTFVITELITKIGIKKTLSIAEGMIAIAIYDKKNKKTYLYRDPVGKKPLYYYYSKGNFAFASEIKAFQKINIPLNFSENYLIDLLRIGHSWGRNTPYNNLHRVLPGQLITITNDNIKSEKISSIFNNFDKSKILDSKKFENLFQKSVKQRTADEVKAGLFLSGGIDSSLVAKYLHKKISCYSFRTNKKDDETINASKTAHNLGLSIDIFDVKDLDFNTIEKYIAEMDEPNIDISYILSLKLCETLPEDLKVIFNGEGADEIFGGYLRSRISYLLLTIPELIGNKIFKILIYISTLFSSKFKRISTFGSNNIENIYIQLNNDLLKNNEIKLVTKNNNINFGNKLFSSENFDNIDMNNFTKRELIYLSDFYIGLQGGLMPKVDLSTMACSIEARSPFLDISIIRYIMSIHPSQKLFTYKRKKILTNLAIRKIGNYMGKGKKRGFTLSPDQVINKNADKVRNIALDPKGFLFKIIDHEKFTQFLLSLDKRRYNKIIYSFWVINHWYKIKQA